MTKHHDHAPHERPDDCPACNEVGELKEFEVTIPITGVAYLTIQATDEEAAIDAALEEVRFEHIEEWEGQRIICRGNVLYARKNEAEAREV